ncbi:MAG TPA: hypothetical protein DD473_06075 [Planctomycetaceae bacterium]|nr:hypothetical protein [Planctomycetaceae bacterium]
MRLQILTFTIIMIMFAASVTQAATKAPSWSARAYDGEKLSQNDYEDAHVLLVFYRGVQCVHCMEQLAGIAKHADEFAERGIKVVAISHELPSQSIVERIRRANDIEFPQCTDPNLKMFSDFESLDNRRRELHGLVLIDPSRQVLWKSVSEGVITNIDKILEHCDENMSP